MLAADLTEYSVGAKNGVINLALCLAEVHSKTSTNSTRRARLAACFTPARLSDLSEAELVPCPHRPAVLKIDLDELFAFHRFAILVGQRGDDLLRGYIDNVATRR